MRSLIIAAIFAVHLNAASLAITGARIYTSPDAAPLANASLVMTDGRIAAVGEHIAIPSGADVLPCKGCVVMAGFWNCHIHFMEPKWDDAAHQPPAKLEAALQAMLLKSGFTTVVDTGSDLPNTVALRRRIESGEIPGPRIYTAGIPIYPPDGIPYYVREVVPAALLKRMIPPRNPKEAVAAAEADIKGGSDILKLFTGSWVQRGKVLPMPLPIAAAAAAVAHQHHQLVFAHPSSLAGVQVAIDGGVDVLAHAPDDVRGVNDTVLRSAVAKHMAMIPTLKLFKQDEDIAEIRNIVRRFHSFGGQLIFGTDTGYLTDYDVSEEFRQLSRTGLNVPEILRMLTENPARRFGVQHERGAIAQGMAADVTVLAADPAADVIAFARVAYTIRAGRVIYRK